MNRSRSLIIGLLLAAALGVGVAVALGAGSAKPPAVRFIVLGVAGAIFLVAVIIALVARSRGADTGGKNGGRSASKQELAAERLGLSYRAKADGNFHHDFGPLPGIPRSGHVAHVFQGSLDGRPLTIFQHKYVVNTGQAVIPVLHVAYLTDAPPWPSVTVSRRNFFGRVLRRLGVRRGLELEEPRFNDAMKIKTEDEDFALTLLHPEMQLFIIEKPAVTWRVHAGCCALIYSGSLRADRMEASLDRLRRFWTLVPEELMAW